MGDRARTWRMRGYRRTAVALAATALLTLGVLLAPSGHAAELEPTPPETGEIRNGTAKAVATIGTVAPGVGNLALGMTTGTAVTQVTNSLAQATSQAADLGLIGSSLTAEGCRGSQYLTPEDLPQPLSADNRAGDASARASEGGGEGAPAFGDKAVTAVDEPPGATARTTVARIELPGLAALGGGEAESTTRVLPGEGREALATVQGTLEIADVVELAGLRWRAHHRTGVEPLAAGSFSVGEAAVGGVPLPTDDLQALEDAVNSALDPLGLDVRFPSIQRVTDPDFVRVTPLVIEVRDSPAGKTILGPGLDATREQRNQAFDDLVAVACELASALLVGDVVISVAGGTGFLTVGIGGVEVSSADLVVGNPFGTFTPVAPVPAPAVPSGPGDPTSVPAPPTAPGAAPPAAEVAAPATRPTRATGPVVELCESLHPNGTSCSEGAAAAVGLLGLLATAGFAGADLVRQRRLDRGEG